MMHPLAAAGSVPSPEETRAQLARILASPAFQSHPRAGAFLEYVVERVLAGRDAEIKQATIGCDVFGRPASYDPRSDAIVRTVARAVREKLNDYYLTVGVNDPVRIEIRKGGYVPWFASQAVAPAIEPGLEHAPVEIASIATTANGLTASPARRNLAVTPLAFASVALLLSVLAFGVVARRNGTAGGTVAAVQGSPADAAALFAGGCQALKRGDFVEARSWLRRAAEGRPGDARIHAALANDLMSLGYNGLALEEARKAEAASGNLAPRDELEVEVTFRAASGDFKGAAGTLDRLLREFPEDLEYRRRLAQAQIAASQPADCLRTVSSALGLANAAGDSQLAVTEAYCRAGIGDYRGALMPVRRGIAAAQQSGQREVYGRARLLEAGILMSINQPTASIAAREEARQICGAIGDDFCSIGALRIEANSQLFEMRPALALAGYRTALPLARKMGSDKQTIELLDAEGCALMSTDDFAGAHAAFVEALLTAQQSGSRTFGIRQDMTELALKAGELDRAILLAEQTEAESRQGGDRVTEAAAQILKARALFLRGDLDRSGRLLAKVRDAIDRFHLSADIPRQWRIADANLNRALGKLETAQQDLDAHDDLGDTSRDFDYRAARIQLLLSLGRYDDAAWSARETLAFLDGSGNRSANVLTTALLSDAYGFSNRFGEARQEARAARALVSAHIAPFSRAAAEASALRWDQAITGTRAAVR